MSSQSSSNSWVKRILSRLPFAQPYVSPTMSQRNVIILAMKRPVEIDKISSLISKEYTKKGPQVIDQISQGVDFLRMKRKGKQDAANLYVAALRAFCDCNSTLGLEFGSKHISDFEDQRAYRTMITHYNRIGEHAKSLELLVKMKHSQWVDDMKSSLKFKVYGDSPGIDEEGAPLRWLYHHNHIVSLSRELYILHYPIDKDEFYSESGNSRIELNGRIYSDEEIEPNAALVCFKFLDENNKSIDDVSPLGLIHSPRVGWYAYLNQKNSDDDSFSIEFETPPGTKRLILGFRLWNPKSQIYLAEELKLLPSSMQGVYEQLNEWVETANSNDSDKIVFMFSGTTFYQLVRANRPIRLTKVLLDLGVPVLFNYHRSSMNEPSPDFIDKKLIQIPTDITQSMLGKIASLDFGNKKKIFVVSYPHPCIPKLLYRFVANGWYTMYDARDEWEEFSKVGQARWYNEANERYITGHCDNVTAVSRPLANKLDKYSPRNPVSVVPNALGWGFLQPDYQWIGDEQKIIGYFGHLTSSWFDWENVLHMAEKRPEFKFELIGHSAPDDLELPPNVELLGPKNHPQINKIAARWSVGIIPFQISTLADAVDPIKIYEYLALGLPTVSFRMPQINDYPYTTTVENVEDFIEALDKMSTVRPNMNEVNSWLNENCWENRVATMIQLVEDTPSSEIRLLEA